MLDESTKKSLAHALLDMGAVGYTPDTPVRFKSGIVAPVYVDNRQIPFWPDKWQQVLDGFRILIQVHDISFDALAGIETAGIPHSAALGYVMKRPSLFVRKQPKAHGKGRQVEGGDVEGLGVLLIEDLITTGGSSLRGVAALREAGATVKDCLCIVSYDFAEMKSAFDNAGVRLHPLLTFQDIAQEAYERGDFDDAALEVIAAWLENPYGTST